jgi:GTP cyclohydrolase II
MLQKATEMSLGPTLSELVARARADLRMGVPVRIGDSLVAAAETLTPDRLQAMRAQSDHYLAITNRRASTLNARAYDGDIARLHLPSDAGIGWIHAMADPADDLHHPMKGPFNSLRGGDADTARAAIALIKSARLLPAAVISAAPATDDLTELPLSDLQAILATSSPLEHIANARVPLQVSELGRVHVFRPQDGGEEHYAIEIGNPDRSKPVLTRLHSACFTGDLIGSLKCDCGPQLRSALAQMGSEGAGILLYMNQEGRGIGLANKMRAYALQDQGFDTVEANHRLGFEDEERDFRLGAEILRKMHVTDIRLLTNNPAKVSMFEQHGIAVAQRVELKVGENRFNTDYLSTKASKSGHLL